MSIYGEAKPHLVYTPEEAAVALRIVRTYLYQLKSMNEIGYIKYKNWETIAFPPEGLG